MKKLFLAILASAAWLGAAADGQSATITSDPSPAISNKPVTVTISTNDLGNTVYCYTWCAAINGTEKKPSWSWDDVNKDEFRMTKSGNTYKFTITDIKAFYGLTDAELEGLTKIGFIAKNTSGGQTADCFISVEQGRRDAYSGGEGTAADPFIIANANDLATLAGYPADWAADVWFKQSASFDGGTITPIGSIGNPFKGHYDGDGHAIRNLTISQNTLGQATGLFGAIDGASVSKLALIGADIEGMAYTAPLIGYAASGTVSQCYASGAVKAGSLASGGLIGVNLGATVTDCYSTADITADNQYTAGGLIGKNLGTVKNTYASGALTGKNYIGGLTGANYGTVSNSAAINSKITAPGNYTARFGGNNNPQNISTGNASWQSMPTGHSTWAQHGDHSLNNAIDLTAKTAYERTLGWDFNTIWKWETKAGHSYPVLAVMKDAQADPFSSEFYNSSAIDAIGADSAVAISVYPNPATDFVRVAAGSEITSISLVSLSGSTVAYSTPAATEATINVARLANGLYIMTVATTGNGLHTVKLIKK